MIYSTKTLKMAVIGDPIDHSISPFMHGRIIEEHGYDALYIPVLVHGDETGRFTDAAKYLGFSGFNATMPHKINLLDIVDHVDPAAAYCGAINTVKIRNGEASGYNTDAPGLLAALKNREFEIKGAKVMIIGAGGASGAAAHAFGSAGASSITVLNRTLAKAEQLTSDIDCARAKELDQENLRSCAAEADLIVNCTPLGMTGVKGDFDDLSFLDDTKAFVADLIYNPWRTKFLARAEERGLKVMNGLDLLIYQGLLSFQIFTDIELDLDAEYRYLFPLCRERLSL
ncbi:MAG: shikimate dehydrogenase [Anaerovoracaceae bacterium]|nr:shikimate dehydrogenase [Bacillota bacterium]MDY2670739.1 shikimate dehydrogenase [Anaerovoracaceae bacterium]